MSHLLESAATDDSVLQSLLSEKYPEIIDALMRKIRDKAVKVREYAINGLALSLETHPYLSLQSNFIKNELNKYQNDMDAVEEEIENTKVSSIILYHAILCISWHTYATYLIVSIKYFYYHI